ncbi:MAG: hypothetical protein ABI652_04160 [Acidobacteriota bacterium]
MTRTCAALAAVGLALAAAGCGDRAGLGGRSPSRVVIASLRGASGVTPEAFGATLLSDVLTRVKRADADGGDYFTTYNDLGQVTLRVVLRDQGQPGSPTAPSAPNAVTFTRYHVDFVRSDGRNAQGLDVPYSFDSAATFTVGESEVTAGFELVRNSAKAETPLKGLGLNGQILNMIANVTFYGRDQAGNDVSAAGSMGVNFGNFADPQ